MDIVSAHISFDREIPASFHQIPVTKSRAGYPAELSCSPWSAGLVFLAYGVRVGLRTNQTELLQQCVKYLPIGWKPSSSLSVDRLYSIVGPKNKSHEDGSSEFQLFQNERNIFSGTDREELFDRLESEVSLYVADRSRRRVFAHAGVVGWGGKAILIPGRSYCGKTTLVAELVRAGAIYYSDEFAVLDQNGLVHPYPRSLQLRQNGGARQRKLPIEALGGVAGSVALPVGLVLLTGYKSGATWRPRHISAGLGLLGILDNTVSARRAPALAMRTLKAVVADSFVVQGARGEAQQVVDWLLTYFHPDKMFFGTYE
jgi:hypothetical protein